MRNGPSIAIFGSLVGDPARAGMLTALMSGVALTAGELAREAGVTPPTATAHLNRLTGAGLIKVVVQGRHRYYELAGPEVAAALEGLMSLASTVGPQRVRPGPRDAAMREARVCYDHLAGRVGVQLFEALVSGSLLAAAPEGLALTALGRSCFTAEGLDVAALEKGSRPLCRSCLDWSERRPHLSGSLGAELLRLAMARGWARREPQSRAVTLAPGGLSALIDLAHGHGAGMRLGRRGGLLR
jgi:DNA-binding transcriptional ArsR family regulator